MVITIKSFSQSNNRLTTLSPGEIFCGIRQSDFSFPIKIKFCENNNSIVINNITMYDEEKTRNLVLNDFQTNGHSL